MTQDTDRSPHIVDVHVGKRIRARRKLLGISQGTLAKDLGLTFQQVQKYERGANRVSASKLYEIATSLETSISYFYEGLADPANGRLTASNDADSREALAASDVGIKMACALNRIDDPAVQAKAVNMVHGIADVLDAAKPKPVTGGDVEIFPLERRKQA